MNFKNELLSDGKKFTNTQRYAVYIASALLFICMFLKFWIDVKASHMHFAIALGVYLIFYIYLVSKDSEDAKFSVSQSDVKVESIFAAFMTVAFLLVVIVMYPLITNMIDIALVTAASIINLIVFVPHALSHNE